MSTDKIADPSHIRHWPGDMEADYIYTLGVAGERFFKEIKENVRIMGAKCSCCDVVFVPPRVYCEKCFTRLDKWIDVGTKGREKCTRSQLPQSVWMEKNWRHQ